MNKQNVRNLYFDIRENYNIDLLSYCPLTSKSVKIITKDNNKLIVKKSKEKVKSKYMFLKNEGLDNIIYPYFNKKKNLLTRLSNDEFCDECYYVLPFYDDNNVLNETKVKSLLEELKTLHIKTSFKRNLSLKKSKNKMEEIISLLDFKFKSLEAYVRTIETQKYDEFTIPILKKYHYMLRICFEYRGDIFRPLDRSFFAFLTKSRGACKISHAPNRDKCKSLFTYLRFKLRDCSRPR